MPKGKSKAGDISKGFVFVNEVRRKRNPDHTIKYAVRMVDSSTGESARHEYDTREEALYYANLFAKDLGFFLNPADGLITTIEYEKDT